MKRIDLLMNEARSSTENTEYTSETGVQDSEFLRAFNDGQDRIQSLILNTYPKMFQKESLKVATANSPWVNIPSDVFMDSRIEKVEYSPSGAENDFYILEAKTTDGRVVQSAGHPSTYIRQSRRILLNPKPSGAGTVRFTHQKAFPRLDLRRGRVSAVTLDEPNLEVDSLTLDTTLLTDDNVTYLNEQEYITVIARDGTIKMKNIPITEVNSSTGTVMIDTFNYESGETIEVGDYVVGGKYATTHSELPDICERYLLQFCQWRILKRDSSSDSAESNQELKEMEQEIVESYSQADHDVHGIPILDGSYLNNF